MVFCYHIVQTMCIYTHYISYTINFDQKTELLVMVVSHDNINGSAAEALLRDYDRPRIT